MAFTTITGSGAAATTLVGTTGVDFATLDTIDGYFVGSNQSADTVGIDGNVQNGTIKGGQGNDTISWTGGATVTSSFVNGNSNNDTIGNAAGNANFFTSTVLGGSGNDTIQIGTISGSTANGNKGTDTITSATTTSSTLFGGQGGDTITATASTSSTVSGDLGNDTLTLGAGTHTSGSLGGGEGIDTIAVTALAAGSTNTFTSNTISGGNGADTITVNARLATDTGNVINGDGGIDTITATNFTARITINGGADGDVINSGTAADTVNGDAGNDAITNQGGTDTITGGTGSDTMTSSVVGERYNQTVGDSIAASVAWTNVGAGTLTEDNSVITFGNGVDQIVGAIGTTANGTRVAGLGTATELSATSNIATLAAGNYVIQGDWNNGALTFTVNSDTGADSLLLRSNGGSLAVAANNGTSSVIFDGTDMTAAANLASIVA